MAASIPVASISLTLAALLALPPVAHASTPDRPPARAGGSTWDVEFKAGYLPDIGVNRNIELDVHKENLRLRLNSRVLAEIPREKVIAVVYDSALHSPLVGYFDQVPNDFSKLPPEGWLQGASLAVNLLVMVVTPLILAPIVNRQHFVSLVWKDGDRHRTVTVQVKDGERDEVRQALKGATGIDWVDAPAERKHVERELKAAKGESFVLKLDREVQVAETYLKRGAHRAVVLPREGSRFEMLISKGRGLDLEDILVNTPVLVEGAASRAGEAEVVYREAKAGPGIAQVRVGERRITLPTYPIRAVAEPHEAGGSEATAVRIAAGQYAEGVITRTTLGGKPAFRFGVHRFGFPDIGGDLYVSSTSIDYDAGPSKKGKRQRMHARVSDVRVVKVTSAFGTWHLLLHVGKRRYRFRMDSSPRAAVGRVEAMRNVKRVTEVESRLANFARLAIQDFDSASRTFEEWSSTPAERHAP